MALFSLIVSLIIAGLVAVPLATSHSYKVGATTSLACLAVGVFFCPALGAFFPPVGLTALGLLIACSLLAARSFRPTSRQIALVSVAMVFVGMAGGVLFSLDYVLHLRDLRAAYPLVSVASRLEYEHRPTPNSVPAAVVAVMADAGAKFGPPPQNAPAWKALAIAEEKQTRWGSRLRALEAIHASIVGQFVDAPGFGIARMSYVNEFALKERRKSPGSLRGTNEKYPPTERPDALRGTPLTATRPTDTHSPFEGRLWDIHESGLNDFFSQEDEGLLIDRDHVAGFVSHRFSKEFPPRPTSTPLKWELVRLELASLRRFGRPMVYATNRELPRMDQLEKMPTREPSAFEAAALGSLAEGEEIVYLQRGHCVLAMGALRAQANCTKCHEVRRGALLGAFSYEFLGNATPAGDAPSAKPPI